MQVPRLAVVASHPVQYYAPWFRFLAATNRVELRVFYLWDGGVHERIDPGFGHAVRWDVPLLDGYAYEFVPNTSSCPGSNQFWGLRNPTLPAVLAKFAPHTAMLIGYNYPSFLRVIFGHWPRRPPFSMVFRGDSHRLIPRLDSLRERLRRYAIAAIYRRFAAVLYVGEANKEYFRWHGVPEERLFFAPHAVDNDRFTAEPDATFRSAKEWRHELGVSEGRALIVFAGKFEDKKRPLDLLVAFAKLGSDLGASLLFVGAGHLEGELRKGAADVPHVHFAPFQNQSQMPRTYAAADLFVLPSYGAGETWGLAINEALCLARPVIVSDHVGCAANLVQPGVNGLVFPAGNIDALTERLREALSNRKRLARWGEEGRHLIERYDYTQASRGLFAALDSLTTARAP